MTHTARFLVLSLFLVSCGGSNEGNAGGNASGLSRTLTIASLSASQALSLCDWTNTKQGGYGRSVTCPDGMTDGTDPSAEVCVESAPTLGALCPTLTVADVEDCVNAIGADICARATNAACANLNECFATQ
jgi:hypothetical protein